MVVWQVASAKEGAEAMRNLAGEGNCRLVFLLGRLADDLKNEIEELKAGLRLNVLSLPDENFGWGLGLQALEEKVRKAVGFKISWE